MFMIDYLKNEGNYTASGLTIEEKEELESLRKEIKKYREMEENKADKVSEVSESSEEENNSEEENDEEFEKLKKKMNKKGNKRAGVSAEVYGEYNKKEDFKARFIPKTEDQILRIKTRILSSFLFSSLDKKDLEIVIGAMEEKIYQPGEFVIKQGDDGDCLYVIEKGELDCSKTFKKEEGEKFLKKYVPGEAFGELALLYNAPRAANIKANTECLLWSLDRNTFNNIVKDAAQKKREKYEEFFKKVEILSTVDSYERMQICDAVGNSSYQKNDFIIREGEMGDVFYILEEGECIATKTLEPGKPAQEIKRYSPGDYFGERSLIKGEPRFANIEVISEYAKVITLDRNTFKRLLGPIEPLLQRNMDKYQKFFK
ncbi:MAG: cyclic nucleotide-binding domain-containing protein [archaeon]|nr:cyclic nucleotide-binding domain-containing protein [archaeon]